jgi:hypothetical protein
MRKLRPEASNFFFWSGVLLLVYLGGWVGFWKYDRAELPPRIADGEEKNGWRCTKIAEVSLPRGEWSDWVDSTGSGEAIQVLPGEVEHLAKWEAKFDDGSTGVFAGSAPTNKKIVSVRVWNGALASVTVQFFTWVRTEKEVIENGRRKVKLTTVTVGPNEWSEWQYRPIGYWGLSTDMDPYEAQHARLQMHFEDGKQDEVPANRNGIAGEITMARVRNDNSRPVQVTFYSWLPVQ